MTQAKQPNPEHQPHEEHKSETKKSSAYEQLARQLRDTDLTAEEYDSLIEDLQKRRRRVDGSGDSLFDDVYEET